MMKKLSRAMLMLVCVLLGACALTPERTSTPERIVIQVSDDHKGTWGQALNVARNLQNAYGPGNAQIEVVAFGSGINMLKAESLVASRVSDVLAAGVKVYACENSMKRFKLHRSDMVDKVNYVDAGIEHIILRYRAGWFVDRP